MIAPVTTHIAGTVTDDTSVESGAACRILGVVFESSDAAVLTFEDTGTSTTRKQYRLAAGGTIIDEMKWIADNGIQVTIDSANATVTIHHTHRGT